MTTLSQSIEHINSLVANCRDPADLSRVLLESFLVLPESERETFAAALIVDLCAREAMARHLRRTGTV